MLEYSRTGTPHTGWIAEQGHNELQCGEFKTLKYVVNGSLMNMCILKLRFGNEVNIEPTCRRHKCEISAP